MPRPTTADPRAELVNWDLIDFGVTRPVEAWTDDDWEDAILGTMAVESRQRREAGLDGPLISFEEVLAKRGLTIEDLEMIEESE